eukprot:TRINITY_DN20902_c0_g1_i1.p1 TRINITY_DN20902_c0_g1~~TRINITY_DN20902_c0_g1_i1.p1  ORF type:complete len:478 (-),score=40.08 TRINITY_DN20902_c0_g1_i1:150-1583(-)
MACHLFIVLSMLLFFTLLSVTLSADAFRIRYLTGEGDIGLLDPTTGNHNATKLHLPPTPNASCTWRLPRSGTPGQSTAIFQMNATWLVLAQLVCAGDFALAHVSNAADIGMVPVQNVILIIFGPWSESLTTRVTVLADMTSMFPPTVSISDFVASWDWTCNVIVSAPVPAAVGGYVLGGADVRDRIGTSSASRFSVETAQVSEYDGAVRRRPPMTHFTRNCTNCLQPIAGSPSVVVAAERSAGWDPELNCGPWCVLVSVWHAQPAGSTGVMGSGVATWPRRLVGHRYRSGDAAFDVPDVVGVIAMSYSQSLNVTFGLGVCCDGAGCPGSCVGRRGALSMFVWPAEDTAPTVVKVLADPPAQATGARPVIVRSAVYVRATSEANARAAVLWGPATDALTRGWAWTVGDGPWAATARAGLVFSEPWAQPMRMYALVQGRVVGFEVHPDNGPTAVSRVHVTRVSESQPLHVDITAWAPTR